MAEETCMEITYLGHSAFKLKGKDGTVVTDPFADSIGLSLPSISADIITVSHQHDDHNAVKKMNGTARRSEPFIVEYPGEYEVGGISVFGVQTFHDDKQGQDRGVNTVYTIVIDDIRICHLGDLGHELSASQLEQIGVVDVLLCPVGGHFTIDSKKAVTVIQSIEPSYIIPMHFQTSKHSETFAEVQPLEVFLKEYGIQPVAQPKLVVEKLKLPEETELVVLEINGQ
jgi:L-ascorbate metabolism protein UlaG (beta-lactamase superfamily)